MEEKEKLISVATLFLAGKDLEKVSEAQKRIFLRRKGLTEEMVEEAFKRSKEKKEQETKATQPQPQGESSQGTGQGGVAEDKAKKQ